MKNINDLLYNNVGTSKFHSDTNWTHTVWQMDYIEENILVPIRELSSDKEE